MAYTYTVYGPKEVQNAQNQYNQVAQSAPVYTDSSATVQARKQANNYANQYANNINKGYQSVYGDTISALANKYQNNKFEFNQDGSTEYQTYADRYRREGAKAQENVQASYAANTGGYANSYAQSAGQRAYGEAMDQLAQKVPQLRSAAQSSWNDQQERTLNQISMLKGFDDSAYQRFRDKVTDSYDFMTYYQNKYTTERGLDMSAFQNELANWQTRMSATQSNLSNLRTLAESQYEHNTLSAAQRAANESSRRQTDAYYNYLMSKVS